MITHRTTIVLGIACTLGSGVIFGSPVVYAQLPQPQPLLAQVKIKIQLGGRSNYRDYYRNKLFPSQHRGYWGNPYYYPPNFYNRSSFYPRYRDSWGNPYYYPRNFYNRGNLYFNNQYPQVQPRFNNQYPQIQPYFNQYPQVQPRFNRYPQVQPRFNTRGFYYRGW